MASSSHDPCQADLREGFLFGLGQTYRRGTVAPPSAPPHLVLYTITALSLPCFTTITQDSR